MKNKSQKDFVIKQLLEKGKISRNFALKNYISRLGALIFDLKEEGWDFVTYTVDSPKPDGSKGKNFVYEVTKCPFKKIVYNVNGKEIITYK
jgi:hypothetical protein